MKWDDDYLDDLSHRERAVHLRNMQLSDEPAPVGWEASYRGIVLRFMECYFMLIGIPLAWVLAAMLFLPAGMFIITIPLTIWYVATRWKVYSDEAWWCIGAALYLASWRRAKGRYSE